MSVIDPLSQQLYGRLRACKQGVAIDIYRTIEGRAEGERGER